MGNYNEILNLLPDRIKKKAAVIINNSGILQEIRLRVNEYAVLVSNNIEHILSGDNEIIKESDIRECFKRVSEYSAYAYEEEIKNGYITIKGGHRVGIAGKVVVEDGHIKTVRHVAYINIRISKQIKGCSDRIIKYIYAEGRIHNTLIISPPGGGKTTLLRDIVRNVSSGYGDIKGVNVGVVDERSEICACYRGAAQNDMGPRTDVLDACPKAEGIVRLIRSMSPRVIAVDEIGTCDDMSAVEYAMVSGCSVIATIHGQGMEDICNNRLIRTSIEQNRFKRFVVMGNMNNAGNIVCVMDEKGSVIYDGG